MDTAPRLRLRLDPAALLLAGQFAVSAIAERTAEGRDADGKAFVPYSARPLALPASAVPKRARLRLKRAQDGLFYFTSRRSGALWFVVEGGYAALKAARYPQDEGTVNLHATGAMLRALRVLGAAPDASGGGTVTLGFSRPEEAQKAFWNSRTRRFLGLTLDEQAEAARVAGAGVSVDVR